jgi:uncharacterized membrane protein YcaP (DUF421 family)
MLISFLRTVFLYLVLIAIIRFLGKRQLGQMEPSEVVVTMVVADLASISMQDSGVPISSSLVPILAVLGMEFLLSTLSLRSIFLRKLLCGKPVILIENGKFLQENIRKSRITLDELSELLRQKDVLRIETVQYAILETNGNLSVFPFPRYLPAAAGEAGVRPESQRLPYTIIADGCVYQKNLTLSGRDPAWLRNTLSRQNCRPEEIFLLTVDDGGNIFCLKKEDAR